MHAHRGGYDDPASAAKIDGAQGTRFAVFVGGEPYFVALGRPGKPLFTAVFAGQNFVMTLEINQGNVAAVVTEERMIEERDLVACGREVDVADVSGGLIENLARRILEAELTVDAASDGEIRSVFVPVGIGDVVEQFASRTTAERSFRQPAGRDPERPEVAIERNGYVAVGRDAQH